MTRKTKAVAGLPPEVTVLLGRLGENIRTARKRRRRTVAAMAEAMFVTPKTLARVERGDPGVGLGVFVTALFVLGLHGDLAGIADPSRDEVGQWEERRRLPKRVRGSQDEGLDF